MAPHYYNEWDKFNAQWLRNMIAAKLIAPGEVDDRSIVDVSPDDLVGFRQCHFFAGIGGWALAARIAGWPDERELWTGSAPCQPFSDAGLGLGFADERDLWPHYFRLIRARRPTVCMGEQVAKAVGKHWLDRVFVDLEGIDYACRAVVLPACAVNAPHRRERIWFLGAEGALGDGVSARLERHAGDVSRERSGADPSGSVAATGLRGGSHWDGAEWLRGHDERERRFQPGVRMLGDGFPGRDAALHAFGNAIVPQEAAEILRAWMDVRP